ncbi:hypothetical protein D3C72_2241000 [compost metagenome]
MNALRLGPDDQNPPLADPPQVTHLGVADGSREEMLPRGDTGDGKHSDLIDDFNPSDQLAAGR